MQGVPTVLSRRAKLVPHPTTAVSKAPVLPALITDGCPVALIHPPGEVSVCEASSNDEGTISTSRVDFRS